MVFTYENIAARALSPGLQEKAVQELNEKPERVRADVEALRSWLQKQPHLEAVTPSDQLLVTFLRGSKYSLEKCKDKLDIYFSLRSLVPELFAKRDPFDDTIQDILKSGAFLPLRKPVKGILQRAILVRYGAGNSRFLLTDLIKVSLMICDIMLLEDDNIVVAGELCIVDMKDMGMNILSQWSPSLAKKVIRCFEDALPIRMKGTLVFNMPFGFETAYNILKTFLGEKLRQRFAIYNKLSEQIHERVPKYILPKEYNGEDGSIEDLIEYWKTKVESYREWFLSQESMKSDEQRRPSVQKKSHQQHNVHSVEGSFRKLEVD